tara:strand:- start:919 stop:1377 length:459 start_codon:yes stop_codon:yes gene_type:complete
MSKECVSCNKTKYGLSYATDSDMPEWVRDNKKQTSIIPEYYMPKIENVVSVDLDVVELKNTLIFYWATESKKMKKVRGYNNSCGDMCKPKHAYGNYCNSGLVRLDKNGKAKIFIESPVAYTTEGDDYYPHIHFTPFDNKTKKWNKEVFTVSI